MLTEERLRHDFAGMFSTALIFPTVIVPTVSMFLTEFVLTVLVFRAEAH